MKASLSTSLNGPERFTVLLTSETKGEKTLLENLQRSLEGDLGLVSDGFIRVFQERKQQGLPDIEIEKDQLHLSFSLARPSFQKCGLK